MTAIAFDLIVVGGGPGGYVAAIRASQLGLKTALIEEKHLGGICLNWGCIPTKALLRSAEVYGHLKSAKDFGLSAEKVSFDMPAIIERSRAVSGQLSAGVKHLLKKNKVQVFEGRGTLLGRTGPHHRLKITSEKGSQDVEAPHVILATGARARTLPHLKADGDNIWSYKEAMVAKEAPKKLLVIGSGAIGIEFAHFFATFGSNVTVVELQDRILPAEDAEISGLAQKAFEKHGMTFKIQTTVEKVETANGSLTATFKTKKGDVETASFDKAILAIGIVGNTEDLGLDKTKAKVEKGQISVSPWCETDESGLYAIGDVAGAPWLAHKASHEGILLVERIAGKGPSHPIRKENIPGCTYSHPQIASIGLTEAQAKEKGHQVKVGRFPFMGNGKAIALGESEGLIKTLFDAKTGELLGAHMIGAEVTELIQGFALAKTCEATEAEIMETIFPHPTLSEMMHESTLAAFDRAIHY